jgi:multidrug resistance efflux pump
MKKVPFVVSLVIAAALFIAACSPATQQPAAEAVSSQPSVLIAQGMLLPIHAMDQAFSIPGQVSEILVEDGEPVAAGQVLARLQSTPEAQLALARAQQEVLLAQQALDELKAAADVSLAQGRVAVIAALEQLEAAQELYAEEGTAKNRTGLDAAEVFLKHAEDTLAQLEAGEGVDPDQLAVAEARLAVAEAGVVSAQAAKDALELQATMDGTVVDLTLQVGQRVAAGQAVITLADYSGWVVKTDNLTEDEVALVEIGQKVAVILDALSASNLDGTVTHINQRFEEKRGDITYTVTIALGQADPLMRWGMTAAVQFLP